MDPAPAAGRYTWNVNGSGGIALSLGHVPGITIRKLLIHHAVQSCIWPVSAFQYSLHFGLILFINTNTKVNKDLFFSAIIPVGALFNTPLLRSTDYVTLLNTATVKGTPPQHSVVCSDLKETSPSPILCSARCLSIVKMSEVINNTVAVYSGTGYFPMYWLNT